jgi:hypothetical protein
MAGSFGLQINVKPFSACQKRYKIHKTLDSKGFQRGKTMMSNVILGGWGEN